MQKRNFSRCAALALCASSALMLAAPAHAGTFDGGIPEFWTCTGSCGSSGANGVVPLAPGGGTAYGWISTYGSNAQVGLAGVGNGGEEANGTTLRSISFDASAGMALDFRFNYVSTDGAGFADYAWARLLDQDNNQVAMLFTLHRPHQRRRRCRAGLRTAGHASYADALPRRHERGRDAVGAARAGFGRML
jgi:hypothetical protein